MKVLIAEDSEEKREDLEDFFSKEFPSYSIGNSSSFKETVQMVEDDNFDLLILDMTMPTKSANTSKFQAKARTLAGRDVLATLKFYSIENIKCIIFSQFGEFGKKGEVETLDEIYIKLSEQYPDLLLGCVKYDSAAQKWRAKLKILIKEFGNC
jgi:CheY-like chemotaxis protein